MGLPGGLGPRSPMEALCVLLLPMSRLSVDHWRKAFSQPREEQDCELPIAGPGKGSSGPQVREGHSGFASKGAACLLSCSALPEALHRNKLTRSVPIFSSSNTCSVVFNPVGCRGGKNIRWAHPHLPMHVRGCQHGSLKCDSRSVFL